ncbi:MAG: acetoacetate--CoA ligase [Thermodesulfobacteriota bacterium]
MVTATIREGDLLWKPSPEFIGRSNLRRYLAWLEKERGLSFHNYHDLWTWSVENLEDFWASLWDFFEIKASASYTAVLAERKMPGARWFDGARLNFAEHIFRSSTPDRPAFILKSEIRPLTEVSWDELYRRVASVAASLRSLGVKPGDRVVAYLPSLPETLTAFLASASLGAVWSSCSPDFGTRAVIDRFKQIEPKVLFAVDGYQYGGSAFDRLPAVRELTDSLPTLEQVVLVPYLRPEIDPHGLDKAILFSTLLDREEKLIFEQVPFDHPLWVVYSSGTTGLPKAMVHGQGGILLEFLKFLGLHMDLQPGDRFFWFSTTGWVMWNILMGGMLAGATPIFYDGNPGWPDLDVLWRLAEETGMTVFGASAAYIIACLNAGLEPGRRHDLSRLKAVGSTGSPLSPEGFKWVYDQVKPDVWLCSVSGGTDPCSAFIGSCPLLPVHAGELQCRCLGVKAEALDEQGRPLTDQVGELVIGQPMPSMPLYLWNDPDHRRYRESYFEIYPGRWRHGDWIKITARSSAVITGRSDSTLNRQGVRIGTSELYSVIEEIPEVADSLVVGYETPGGGYYLPLFVVLKPGFELDDGLKKKINARIRGALSPRHVPDEIYSIREVPRTLNMKKLEVPVKRILQGVPVEKAVNLDSMSNPGAMEYFVALREKLAGNS